MEYSKLDISKVDDVRQLFANTFSDSDSHSEGELIGNLACALITDTAENDFYGFVATQEGNIIGSILFTRLTFESNVNAFLLSPVAIATIHQNQGIGQQLITFGIDTLRSDGVELLVTYGDPNYYSKVGFSAITEDVIKAPHKLSQPHGWQAQSLVSKPIEPIAGGSYCVDAFDKAELW